MKRVLLVVAVISMFGIAACGGGGGGGGDDDGNGLNGADSVTGTVLSASGDSVPGTVVYLPGTEVAAQVVKASRSFEKAEAASDGTECEDPPSADDPLAVGCSAQDGTFTIDTSSLTTNPTQIIFQKGNLRMIITLNCTADPCVLSVSDSTFGSEATWPTVAVVTGYYDRMEDVLAKLADSDRTDETNGQYGRVCNLGGTFVYGSEYGTNMTIIDGTGYTAPTENTDSVSYRTWLSYLDGTNALVVDGAPVFDIIFINCGNAYESSLIANKTKLQEYVDAGGRLYVTDLSYDFVEQPFPAFMQFEGEADDSDTPGVLDAAQTGTSGLTINAAVNEATMASWLGGVTVNAHDASTPGNPDVDCSNIEYNPETGVMSIDQVTGALTGDGLIPLGDFLSGWAHMVGQHTGGSSTIWISSGEGEVFDLLDNRPLTASRDYGGGGQIVYSSYHTAHSCPTTTFWPQERVLQNLIFGAF